MKEYFMKSAFSLNMNTLYKGVVSLLVLFLLSGCDPCREPLEKQAKQHKLELDTKQTGMNTFKEQVLVLDSEIAHQKQVTQELKTAYGTERTELQERLNKQQNELELSQQTVEKNRLENSQLTTQLEQTISLKEEVETALKNSQASHEQALLEKQTLHETHEQLLSEQQERLDVTQSVLVERGLQLAEQKKELLAVVEERNQLQQELSDKEVQLPPMYESSDPKAQVELNVLYTHLVAEQKQEASLKNKLAETAEKMQQIEKDLIESRKTAAANEELAGSWEQQQTQSIEKIAELSNELENVSHNFLENKELSSKQQQEIESLTAMHQQVSEQLDAVNQTLEQTVAQLHQRESELHKLRPELLAGNEKNALLLDSEDALKTQLNSALSVKNEILLVQESFGQQLAETTVLLEQTQMQLRESEQQLEAGDEKIIILNNEREKLQSNLTKLQKEFEQIRLYNSGLKNQKKLDLQKADIKREELQSKLDSLSLDLKKQQLQLATALQEIETKSVEITAANAANKQLTDDINASEQQRSNLLIKLEEIELARLEAEAKAREIRHTVQPGESLSNISKKYYGDVKQWKKLLDANGLDNADVIQPGQSLLIPRE